MLGESCCGKLFIANFVFEAMPLFSKLLLLTLDCLFYGIAADYVIYSFIYLFIIVDIFVEYAAIDICHYL